MFRSHTSFLNGALAIASAATVTLVGEPCLGRDWKAISRNAEPAMVYIVATQSNLDGSDHEIITSSGFLVGATDSGELAPGYGITVAHGVPEAGRDKVVEIKASVGTRDGPQRTLTVVERDLAHDVALFLLELSSPGVKGLFVNTSPSTERGSELGALGFSLGGSLRFVDGRLSKMIGQQGRWETSLPLNRGDSGGPVFDSEGKVIGVAVGGQSDANAITYVIPANLLSGALTFVPRAAHIQAYSSPSTSRYRVFRVAKGDVLHVRTRPSASAPDVTQLQPDARGLTKLGCENGWCRIGQNGRELGYVNSRYLAEDAPGDQESSCESLDKDSQGNFSVVGVKRDDTLKIRKEPRVTSGNVVADIPANATDVQVGVCSGGWCLVRHDGLCGYVSSQFLAHGESGQAPSE